MSSQLSSNIVNLVQKHWADVLNSDPELASVCKVVPENIKDIDFEIRNALQRQGIAGVIMTPNLTYRGRDGNATYWDVTGMEISFTENPIVNRASNKPADSWASAQDCACRAAQVLAGPAFPSKSDCVVKRQETGEYQGLLVSKILVDCLAELHSEPAPLECIQLEIASGSTFQYKLSRLKSIEDTPIQMQTYNRETGIAGDWEDIKSPATASSLTGGECLRFRAKPSDDYMNQPLSSFFKLEKTGGDATLKMSGDLWKLYTLDNSAEPDAFDTFRGLFKGWTWLEDAGDTTVGGTIKERGRWIVFGDQAFEEAFAGCTSLKRAPMILATTADFDHIYYNMYHGCTSLKEIHWNRELADKEDYYIWWEMPGAPRFGAPASTKVIFDL